MDVGRLSFAKKRRTFNWILQGMPQCETILNTHTQMIISNTHDRPPNCKGITSTMSILVGASAWKGHRGLLWKVSVLRSFQTKFETLYVYYDWTPWGVSLSFSIVNLDIGRICLVLCFLLTLYWLWYYILYFTNSHPFDCIIYSWPLPRQLPANGTAEKSGYYIRKRGEKHGSNIFSTNLQDAEKIKD